MIFLLELSYCTWSTFYICVMIPNDSIVAL